MSASLRWTLAPGLQAAFSTAADGDLHDEVPRRRWLAAMGVPHPCAVAQQVHGAEVVTVTGPADQSPIADGLVTTVPHLALGVFGADCPGLALMAPDALGAAHCGWRGTAAGMVDRLAESLARVSRHPPGRWHAFIGPGIAGPSYEVDAPVLDARTWPTTALIPRADGRAFLDLPTVLAADCHRAGITAVTCCGVDTASDARLHSYRRAGKGPIQMLVVWRGDGKAAGG